MLSRSIDTTNYLCRNYSYHCTTVRLRRNQAEPAETIVDAFSSSSKRQDPTTGYAWKLTNDDRHGPAEIRKGQCPSIYEFTPCLSLPPGTLTLGYTTTTMASTDFILPQGSVVLVTGANGYIASHIVDQLLQRGYRVRGTVRNVAKASWVQELFDKRYDSGRFELTSISDYTKPEAFTDVLKGRLFPLPSQIRPSIFPDRQLMQQARRNRHNPHRRRNLPLP